MTFQETLNDYILQLDCTGKDLAAACGVAPSAISRYRTGVRVPDADGRQLAKLARGIAALAAERGLSSITEASVENTLRRTLSTGQESFDREVFSQKLDELLNTFAVSNRELARFLSFDSSHVARIRSGQRTPGDAPSFAVNTGYFIARRCQSNKDRERLSALVGTEFSAEADTDEYARCIAQYLMANSAAVSTSGVGSFLQKMDDFDLDEYIRVIHFDALKAPVAPLQIPASHVYTGLKELMDAQLDFLKTTVLSRSDGDVTMFSDLPMTEMSKDPEFPKKWMFVMAVMLKKGLRLNMIHNVDRPFHEMMLGLESYIPMYMTGQISPYYLTGTPSSPFRRMLWVSDAAALQGDCISGHIRDGRMYLTNRKNDLVNYRKMASQLLQRAEPLMEIFGQDQKAAYERFLRQDEETEGPRRSILSSLPVFALSDDLAQRILERNAVPAEDLAAILRYAQAERRRMDAILSHSPVSEVLPEISREEYLRWPMGLSLAGMFYPGDVRLSYEEYREHMALCEAYAADHPGYSCARDKNVPFRNIQITILEGERVIISKNKSPAIHFIIRHPKLIDAIENMVMPLTD